MSAHTPTPWFLNDSDIPPSIYTISQEDPSHQPCIAVLDADKPYFFDGVAVQEANAEFIVRACNSHDALIAALTGLLECAELNQDDLDGTTRMLIENANAALTAAGAA